MTIGIGILLIAVGAILRFGISTVATHGIGVHTIGDILMVVGVLGVVLWLLVWAPWAPRARARGRRRVYREPVYRDEVPPPVYRDEVPPDEVPPARRYPDETAPIRRYPHEDEYRR
ncbi:MAG TPA: hypothetical protein VMG13_00465 [Trebonia sp.]|nr:hypothetical protein [Trebonia sp.]